MPGEKLNINSAVKSYFSLLLDGSGPTEADKALDRLEQPWEWLASGGRKQLLSGMIEESCPGQPGCSRREPCETDDQGRRPAQGRHEGTPTLP